MSLTLQSEYDKDLILPGKRHSMDQGSYLVSKGEDSYLVSAYRVKDTYQQLILMTENVIPQGK